jgi:hypothetical protein
MTCLVRKLRLGRDPLANQSRGATPYPRQARSSTSGGSGGESCFEA